MITQNRYNWRSFAGGEISEELYGRNDLPKNQTGLRRCYNFLVTPQGALENRGGTRFVATTKSNGEAWLMPFVRADGQGFLLEFGNTYIRIHLAAGTLTQESSPATVTNVTVDPDLTDPVLFQTSGAHGFSVDTPVVLRKFGLINPDPLGIFRLNQYQNRRMLINTVPASNQFTIKTIYGVPLTWADLAVSPYNGLILPGNVQNATALTPLELVTGYSYSHARKLSTAQFVDELALAHSAYPPGFVKRTDDQTWAFANTAFNQTLAAPGGVAAVASQIEATDPADPLTSYNYTVTTLQISGEESGAATPDAVNNSLRIAGNYNTVTWTSVTGSFRYNVYKGISSGVFGFIGATSGVSFIDDNILPDYTLQPPDLLAEFNNADNYPSVVAFHEQRCIFANTPTEPQSFWMSGLAGFGYFKASYPPQDDQAFTYELSSQKAAPILHIMALNDVLFFTASGVFRVYARSDEGFGPTTVASIPVSSYGASANVAPQEVGSSILFPVERGSHVFALRYDGSEVGYKGDDLSLIADHLINGYSWIQTTVQRAPYPVWWGLRSDGKIIGLTYIAEQQVYGWHQHELPDGFVESIAAVPEGQFDALYAVVRRTIAGNTVRYIERFEPRLNNLQPQEDAYFVDCGITYRGPETDTFTGLGHIEGETVLAVVDGRVLGPYVVTGGQIIADDTGTVAHVGLNYWSEIETLPLTYDMQALGIGVEKNVSQVNMRVKRTLGLEAGVSFEHLRPMISPVDELLGDTPLLRSGIMPIDIEGEWLPDATVCIRQRQPQPATITGLAVDFVGAE